MRKAKKIFNAFCWTLLGICLLSACVMVVVSVVDQISRNEAEWTDGGGRHVEEMVSVKISEEE